MEATRQDRISCDVGRVAFVGLGVAEQIYDSDAADKAFLVLLLVPILLCALLLLLSWSAFFVGTITGTPLVSLSYSLSAIKRNWRSVVGGILLSSVLCAVIAAVAFGIV